MKFDYSKGKEPKYIVTLHGEMTSDRYYFHYYKDSKKMFDNIDETDGYVSANIYDLKTDVRKDYKMF